MVQFNEWPKMARFSRDIIITEKIDGTNSSVFIQHESLEDGEDPNIIATINELTLRVGSRNRWIRPGKATDNAGFAGWVYENKDNIILLGEGHHFGEWWGSGIQRGYGLSKGEKRFSLFNTYRWADEGTDVRPGCCHVVPVLYSGVMDTIAVDKTLASLADGGSVAAPGFMNPEGIIIWHTAANIGFKKTILHDEIPKSLIK